MRHQRDHLAKVERRAAAKADHAIMLSGFVNRDAVGHVPLVGVRVHLGKHRAAKACRFEHIERAFGNRQARQRLVGYQQRALDANRLALLGQFGNATDTELDRGGVRPVPVGNVVAHFVTFLRW